MLMSLLFMVERPLFPVEVKSVMQSYLSAGHIGSRHEEINRCLNSSSAFKIEQPRALILVWESVN